MLPISLKQADAQTAGVFYWQTAQFQFFYKNGKLQELQSLIVESMDRDYITHISSIFFLTHDPLNGCLLTDFQLKVGVFFFIPGSLQIKVIENTNKHSLKSV